MDALLARTGAINDTAQFAPWAIVSLNPVRDRPALEHHFAALGDEDLRYRFCGYINTAGVTRYLDQLSAAETPSFGIFDTSRALIAFCQLGLFGRDLEVGLTILPTFRRRGFGKALLHRAASYALAQGLSTLFIHSLADNTPMLSLARRIGMTVAVLQGEADGRLLLRADVAPTSAPSLRNERQVDPWSRLPYIDSVERDQVIQWQEYRRFTSSRRYKRA